MRYNKNPHFNAYIKSIAAGPLTCNTVHNAVLEGSKSLGENHLRLWDKLVEDLGDETAKAAVTAWIKNPYQLPRSK